MATTVLDQFASGARAMTETSALPGVIPIRPWPGGDVPTGRELASAMTETNIVVNWWNYVNPAQQQIGPSCGGNACANWWEVRLRRDVPEPILHDLIQRRIGHRRWQLDGYALWAAARDHFYRDRAGGLTMAQIAQIPRVSGLCPDATPQEVTADQRHLHLFAGPLVIGLALAETWKSPRSNGYIEPALPNPFAGHAFLVDGLVTQDGIRYETVFNSWGRSWSVHGRAITTSLYLTYCQLDFAVTWQVPDDWWQSLTWLSFVVADNGT